MYRYNASLTQSRVWFQDRFKLSDVGWEFSRNWTHTHSPRKSHFCVPCENVHISYPVLIMTTSSQLSYTKFEEEILFAYFFVEEIVLCETFPWRHSLEFNFRPGKVPYKILRVRFPLEKGYPGRPVPHRDTHRTLGKPPFLALGHPGTSSKKFMLSPVVFPMRSFSKNNLWESVP